MYVVSSPPWFVSHEPKAINRILLLIYEPKCLISIIEIHQKKSHTSINKIYYWTSIIHKWLLLLSNDFNKKIIVDSLKYLSDKELITVYAFVLMPNHIHLVWQQNALLMGATFNDT